MSRKVELFFQKSIQLESADIVDFKLTKEGRDRLKNIEYASVDVLAEIEKSDISKVNKEEFSQLTRFLREDIDEFFKNSIDSTLQRSQMVSQLAMPKISFFFYKDDQGYVLNIMDQGIGFSEDYIEKFNQPGGDYQHNSSKVIGEDLGGAGLGMKNLKEKLQKINGGQCSIFNRLSDSGVSIMIILPVLPELASDKLLREVKEEGRIRTIVGKIVLEEEGKPISGPLMIGSGIEKESSIIDLDDDFDEEDLAIRKNYAQEKSKSKDGKLNEPRKQLNVELSVASLRLFSPSSEKISKPVDFITPEKSSTPGQY